MAVHPEDAASYADTLHRDLTRIAEALERQAELLGMLIDGEAMIGVGAYQRGAWITREDRA